MLAPGNAAGAALISGAMDALTAQARAIETVAIALHLQVVSSRSDRTAGGGGTSP